MVGEAQGSSSHADGFRSGNGSAALGGDRKMVDRALKPNGTSAVFQPIAELRSGRVIGLEALGRIGTPGDGGICEVLDAASRTGQRVEFELALVRRALRAARAQPRVAQVFVNASPETFASSGLARTIRELMPRLAREHGIGVVIELTERCGSETIGALVDAAERLRSYGAAIALDDIGAGFQDLVRLASIRPEWIKIDRGQSSSLERSDHQRATIAGLVQIAEGLGAKVIAEGVERATQASVLGELGVRWCQGYWVARPSVKPWQEQGRLGLVGPEPRAA